MDGLITTLLKFPLGVSHEETARLLAALTGLSKPVHSRRDRPGTPILVFEVVGTAEGVFYRLSFPRELASTVPNHLFGVMPNLGIERVPRTRYAWRGGVGLSRLSPVVNKLDLSAVGVVLNSFSGLRPGEALMAQFVTTPFVSYALDLDDLAFSVLAGRLVACGPDERRAQVLAQSAVMAYRGLAVVPTEPLSRRELSLIDTPEVASSSRGRELVSVSSLAVLLALPINSPQVAGLVLGRGKHLAPDPAVARVGRVLARATFAGSGRELALSLTDRMTHVYIIGPTFAGKSTVMERSAVADIRDGYGVAVIDPKGDLVDGVLARLPAERMRDVVLLDFANPQQSVGFNILAGDDPYRVMGDVVGLCDRLFDFSSSAPRALDVLRRTVLSLAFAGLTLVEIPVALEPGPRGQAFRRRLASTLPEPGLRQFWEYFSSQSPKDQGDIAAPILRRLWPLVEYPQLKASLGQTASGFSMDQVLAENKILLVPLRAGHLPEEVVGLVASLVMTQLWRAVQRRPANRRNPFFAYVDEFQDCMNVPTSYESMFAKARSYRLGLTIAHTRLDLSASVRDAVFANARTKLVFQTTSHKDAEILAKELGPPVASADIAALGAYEIIARFMAGGSSSPPVTAVTLPPFETTGLAAEAVRVSLDRYARPSVAVRAEIEARHGSAGAPAGPPAAELAIGWEELPDEEPP